MHADETSWSLHSVWAFLSENVRVLLFGVHKDAATLEAILDPATFAGIVISDDAAVYANFTHSQKCWAHLLRKAIKLTLQDPDNAAYRDLADQLLAIYRDACRVPRDRRLSEAGRPRKVAGLDERIVQLCGPVWFADLPPLDEGPANDYRLLCHEVLKLMLAEQPPDLAFHLLRSAALLFAAGLHRFQPRGDPLFKAPEDGFVLVAAVPAAAQDKRLFVSVGRLEILTDGCCHSDVFSVLRFAGKVCRYGSSRIVATRIKREQGVG